MGFKKHFSQTIAEHYPGTAGALLTAVDHAYARITAGMESALASKNPMDKRLDFSAYFLALIQVLEEAGESFDQIRKICLEVTTSFVEPKNKLQQVAKRLPPKLINTPITPIFLRVLDQKLSQQDHEGGFAARIITDKEETYGFGYGIDIIECGICHLFAKHRKQKYVPILCEVDKLTSSLAGLDLIRTGTIANGAAKCDFRFRRR